MLPTNLKCFAPTYYFSFLSGVLPFKYNKGLFKISKLGIFLWCVQFVLAGIQNWISMGLYKEKACNNALSCALYIQELVHAFIFLIQITLIIIKRKQTKHCLDILLNIRQMQNALNMTMSNIRIPVLSVNFLFKIITIGRCLFMYIVKPKLQASQILPYMTTITQIEIENTEITLFYLAAASIEGINSRLEKHDNELTPRYLRNLQDFHNLVCYFCNKIQAAYSINITTSVFSVLMELLLVVYFETSLNVKPIKRNLLVELYLLFNIVYAAMNLLRIAAICRACSKIYEQYNNTELILQRLLNVKEDEEFILHIEYFTVQVQLRRFQFTGLSLIPINMELVTEIVSMVAIYATTMVGFTTFSADTASLYGNYIKKIQ